MPNLLFHPSTLLVDDVHRNRTDLFYDSNEEEKFYRTKNKIDPKYLEKDITYSFNSLGYRTGEVRSARPGEFVLFFGCSHTEGFGLFEEEIWCSQLSSKIGIDKVNLGKASASPSLLYMNTLQYIKNSYPTPRLVVYQWPQSFRREFAYIADPKLKDRTGAVFVFKNDSNATATEKKDTAWHRRRFCMEYGEQYAASYSAYTASNCLWKALGVPVFNWSWDNDFNNLSINTNEDLTIINTVDTGRARDLSHDGSDIHRQVVDLIKPRIDRLL